MGVFPIYGSYALHYGTAIFARAHSFLGASGAITRRVERATSVGFDRYRDCPHSSCRRSRCVLADRPRPKAGCRERDLTEAQRGGGTSRASYTSRPALEAYYGSAADKPAACTIGQSCEGQLADARRPMKEHRLALRWLALA
jgi:hypothetical protein